MGTPIKSFQLAQLLEAPGKKLRQGMKTTTPSSVRKRNILFVTSEHTDLIKAGGLGDVSAALPKALSATHDIRILIPGYKQIIDSGYKINVVKRLKHFAGIPACDIGQMTLQTGQKIYLVLCPKLYERDGNPYGDAKGNDWRDNPIRFARLGLAAAEIAASSTDQWQPELVHANDWPAAMTPAYMKWFGLNTPSVFTIHNLAHQGLCDFSYSDALGLPPEVFGMESMEFYGQLSFLKAGIGYASHVTTVSETYAREITKPELGCGLEGLLKYKFDQGMLSGITNGIDESWESRSDHHLVESFCARDWKGKEANTRYVEDMFDLPISNAPVFAVVSRLAHQKGLDLTLGIAETIVNAGGRLVVMGRGERDLETELMQLARRFPQNIGVHIGFNEADARRIFAGSDFLLMPSRFEPCGLSQMYAQRFGSLPIARKTGGLADTIEDGVSGFLFDDANLDSYRSAVQRALNVFNHPNLLNAMRCKAIASPLSWRQAIQPYDNLYRQLLGENLETNAILKTNVNETNVILGKWSHG